MSLMAVSNSRISVSIAYATKSKRKKRIVNNLAKQILINFIFLSRFCCCVRFFLVASTRLYKSLCRSVGLSVCRSVCPTLLLGLKLAKAKKRKRQRVSGNQWEKDEEEDTKKKENIRHQKKDCTYENSKSKLVTNFFCCMQEIHHKSISVCKHIGGQGCQCANKSVCLSVSKFLK